MNIALLTPSKNPYSETFIQAHKTGLAGNVFYYYGTGDHIKLEGYGQLYKRIGLKRQLLNKILKKKDRKIWDFIIESFTKNNIDAMLVEYGTHAYHLLPLLKRVNIPVVVHFHGYDASMKQVLKKVNHYKEVFTEVDKIVVVSNKMKEMLLNMRCPESKLVLNTYGPRDEFFNVNAKGLKKQFIAIGRFTNKKAPYYLVLAFNKVIKKHPESKLIIAGNGELLNTTQNIVRYLNLEDNVVFPGIIDSTTYRKYLEESRAFVQHSLVANSGDMEGTPLAILEALASGVPVIATYHAGIPDVVVHNESGLLSNEHDVGKMATHMDYLLENKEKAHKMGQKGRESVKTNFNLSKHLTVLDDLFNELIS